jgi:hypothetical protein
MADAIELLTRVPSIFSVPVLGAGLLAVTVYARYATVARYLKWLTLVLFAYAVAAVLARPDWRASLAATFVPAWRLERLLAERARVDGSRGDDAGRRRLPVALADCNPLVPPSPTGRRHYLNQPAN